MTKVFIADVTKLNTDIQLYKGRVSEYRYEKAESCRKVADRILSIGAELLLADYLGRCPDYSIDEYGKPMGEEVHFNFSHSGTLAVCAVSDNPVGVDVEKIRDVNLDIAKKKFCHSEYERIWNSENPKASFFDYWVKKESFVKALGKGLRIPLNEFDVDNISDWRFYIHHIEGYKICACAKDNVVFTIKNLSD